MNRVEIIAHEALENPLLEALCPVPEESDTVTGSTGRPFTLARHVAGRGHSGSSMGDEVWPETNIWLTLFADEKVLKDIEVIIKDLRGRFPQLGLAVFVTRGVETY